MTQLMLCFPSVFSPFLPSVSLLCTSPSAIPSPPPLPPPPPILLTGEHLRICAQGYTCCTSDMEDNLATLSRRELEGLLKDDGRSLQTSLTGQYKAFDGTVNY